MRYDEWVKNGFALTNKCSSLSNRLVCSVKVHAFPQFSTGQGKGFANLTALWDTGATTTMIDGRIANMLGLIPTGKCDISHAVGSNLVNTYTFLLELPGGFKINVVNACEGNFDLNKQGMLIGMDIILQGDFFTGQGEESGKPYTYFTFTIPSTGRNIDFVAELNSRRKAEARPMVIRQQPPPRKKKKKKK